MDSVDSSSAKTSEQLQSSSREESSTDNTADTTPQRVLEKDENGFQENSITADEEERRHFLKIISSFQYYYEDAMKRIDKNEKSYSQLPKKHQSKVEDFLYHLKTVRHCVKHNANIIKEMTREASCIFVNASPYEGGEEHNSSSHDHSSKHYKITQNDMDKVRSTLKQFVRDWSESGAVERQQCYVPVVESIKRFFPYPSNDIKILVPGAGLGRLTWEIARLGYACQGNEWSLYMLIASNFVLNKCSTINQYSLYPWAYQFCNNLSREHQIQGIKFPDVNPTDLPINSEFSMAAGDFLDVYQESCTWDCISTVFFIDTAHNVINYIESFWNLLKPGGYWINIGPLLYHYADIPGEFSLELAYDDLRQVIENFGFEFIMEQKKYPTHYTQNPQSMLQYIYNSVFFIVRKPLNNQSGVCENSMSP